MYKQFGASFGGAIDQTGFTGPAPAGRIDALVALERIGMRRSFARDNVIYAEGDASGCWYKVIAGTVRITKLLADGRRHIAEFHSSGDCFGLDDTSERPSAAEAVGDVIVMRYPRGATDRLVENDLRLARHLCHMTLGELAHAQTRMLLLGRMTATERVANFLLEMADRRDGKRTIDLPMSRTDIADYLGLTIETVCRVLSA
jgi:CRP/FNR family transcriptional regulator, nitrogen fixation regulation protein